MPTPQNRATASSVATLLVAAAVVLGAALVTAAPSAAQVRPVRQDLIPSSTTTPASTEPSTTEPPTSTTGPGVSVPGDPGSTTVPPPAAPLPTAPLPTLPPELAADPRAAVLVDPGPDDGGELPVRQGPWNPASNQVLRERVAQVVARIREVRADLAALGQELGRRRAEQQELADRLGRLDADARRRVAAAARARRELREHAVDAFITGRVGDRIVAARVRDPSDLGVARRYLESVVHADRRAVRAYEAARDELTRPQAALSAAVADAATAVVTIEQRITGQNEELLRLADEQRAYEAGSHVYVRGFVFPVTGPVEFIDSWGFPRMMGTPSAHWHQGSDIFAPVGTPLVAAESGHLARIGQASLGGNKLWVVGDSGTEYYYAHLSAYAPGVAEGRRVNAGDVVGFVGDTGNARGGPPHLHFEIHPGGGDAVNPYPLLRAAYGATPMVQVVLPPATSPTTAPAAPPGAPTTAGG